MRSTYIMTEKAPLQKNVYNSIKPLKPLMLTHTKKPSPRILFGNRSLYK